MVVWLVGLRCIKPYRYSVATGRVAGLSLNENVKIWVTIGLAVVPPIPEEMVALIWFDRRVVSVLTLVLSAAGLGLDVFPTGLLVADVGV